MIDHDKIMPIIEGYKKYFPEHWKDEKYKWEAIKHFQDNWDIEAPDFAKMLDNSLAKTENLLASINNFPRGMIVQFAQAAPEEVRGMFTDLFDESREVFERIDEFKTRSAALLEKYRSDAAQHYQNENAVSIYLWLRYPDKYYIYKFGEIKTVAEELGCDYRFKKGAYAENVRNFYKLYDEMCEELKKDTELVELFKSKLTDSCWQDNELKTLTIDVGFYISRFYSQRGNSDNWFGTDFDPGLSVEDWGRLLRDNTIFNENSLEIMKRMKDYGGAATCTQLSVKYGETVNFYNSGSVAIARRVCEAMGIAPYVRKDGTTQWWSMLYTGRSCNKDEEGSFVWKLRDELAQALDGFDLSGVELYANRNESNLTDWFGTDFNPGLSAEDWGKLLRDKTVFNENSLEIMKRMKDCGGAASCRQLSEKYGESNNFYNSGSAALAKRVCEATGISPNVREDGITQWWTSVLYIGRGTENDEIGSTVWKLRDELSQALDNFDLSGVELYANKVTYLSEIIASLKELGGTAPLSKIYDTITERGMLPAINTNENWKNNVNAELQKHCNQSRSFVEGNQNMFYPVYGLGKGVWGLVGYYGKADFLKEVFMTEGEYDRLRALVLRKKNVILQGAPGVGKTFSAKRLAYSIIGEKNKNRVCMVQFHQNYSYEDFIMGYRPNDSGGFDLQTGVFYDFCERCRESCEPYFFIIDEINRGNLSKIFGELLMLIENDKRGEEHKINPVYGGKPFYIPENLHIIGMMNTADRSLAMIDYALRRRFSFYTMRPAFEDAQRNGFGEYTKNIGCELYHKVIAKIKDLNAAIRSDSALGRGFEIGHSYFAPEDTSVIDDEWVRGVVEFEIIPLIEEYWFDDDKRVKEWTDALRFATGEIYDR